MIDYGTPDLSYKSDCSMSSVFTKNGVQTFAAYNTDSTTKTVTFTDSSGNQTQFKAVPNKITLRAAFSLQVSRIMKEIRKISEIKFG